MQILTFLSKNVIMSYFIYQLQSIFVQLPIVNGYENNYLSVNVYQKVEVKQRELKCTEYSI